MELAGVLETVVYCTTENEAETRRFYRDVLGLRPFSDESSGHRLGGGVFLLFNRDESLVQDWPPPHGASGPVHTCFLAAPGDYERWKNELTGKGVEIVNETTWDSGPRSFYFEDPAGNMLEIAEADMWPRKA
jgi:catechol 2,3-dioxygenase-like lactoylglutathione lyase family enzyme